MAFRARVYSSDWAASIKKLAAGTRRATPVVLKQQARLFVGDVVKVTPPNKDFKMNAAGGRKTIANDVRKVFVQSRRAAPADPRAYEKLRNRRGRVGKIASSARIAASNVAAFIKTRQARVGLLAAGWNAAAIKLGAKLPAWITRHGSKRGQCAIRLGGNEITIINRVPFVGNVKSFDLRVRAALGKRELSMRKDLQLRAIRAAAREAGFKRAA